MANRTFRSLRRNPRLTEAEMRGYLGTQMSCKCLDGCEGTTLEIRWSIRLSYGHLNTAERMNSVLPKLAAEHRIHEAMPKSKAKAKPRPEPPTQPDVLKGWKQIAAFLGEPVSVVQRWASTGMPVRHEGQFVSTTPKELNDWLEQESGKPVRVVTDESDLTSELKRGLSFVRKER